MSTRAPHLPSLRVSNSFPSLSRPRTVAVDVRVVGWASAGSQPISAPFKTTTLFCPPADGSDVGLPPISILAATAPAVCRLIPRRLAPREQAARSEQ